VSTSLVLEYKALDPVLGLLSAALTQRVLAFSKKYFVEGDAELQTKQFMARIVIGDPGIKAAVVITPQGELVGHAIATLEGHGDKRWIYGWQLEVDGKQEGAVEKLLALAEAWGVENGATNLFMSTHRSDKAYAKKYQFTSKYTLMGRPIPFKGEVVSSARTE
jgi:hypothetical protein